MNKHLFILTAFGIALFGQSALADEVSVNSCTSWRELKTCQIEVGKKYNLTNVSATATDAAEIGAKIKDGAFIGMYVFEVPQNGFYKINISAKSWVDVFQDGQKLKSKGSNMPNDGVWFKSVRFDLSARKATLLLSGDITQNAKIEIVKE